MYTYTWPLAISRWIWNVGAMQLTEWIARIVAIDYQVWFYWVPEAVPKGKGPHFLNPGASQKPDNILKASRPGLGPYSFRSSVAFCEATSKPNSSYSGVLLANCACILVSYVPAVSQKHGGFPLYAGLRPRGQAQGLHRCCARAAQNHASAKARSKQFSDSGNVLHTASYHAALYCRSGPWPETLQTVKPSSMKPWTLNLRERLPSGAAGPGTS